MTDLKTVLASAIDPINAIWTTADGKMIQIDLGYGNTLDFDADRLAKAVMDHFLDREKVRAALEATLKAEGVQSAIVSKRDGADENAAWHLADMIADRLIAGLARGSE